MENVFERIREVAKQNSKFSEDLKVLLVKHNMYAEAAQLKGMEKERGITIEEIDQHPLECNCLHCQQKRRYQNG